ncbi:P27 family phage terminase small subunit [Mangrovicoccus ximenensis]|uniref:P27 family phage terminase small subunit n=1 Tax=Mangrovicoccus ximenensis TaxID=1911570 RepID=UPI000D3C52E0|nr:P27 family phage terminase small subunit [Mangrovicoccus ximenensis]
MRGAKPEPRNVLPFAGETTIQIPDAPEWMSTEGTKVWEQLAPVMAQKKRLEGHYEHSFAAYCEACADFIRFTGEIATYGSWYEVKTRNGLQQKHTAVWKQRQEVVATMQRLGAVFGMTPVDEQRLSGEGQGSFMEQLMGALKGNDAAD